jgi:phospholipase/carboxylesterase
VNHAVNPEAKDLVASWPHLYLPGDHPPIITLHGFGGNETEVSALGAWLKPGASVLSPRGEKNLDGAHYWYGTLGATGFAPDDLAARTATLMDFLRQASSHYGFGLSKAVIAGFSNGAAMALALATEYPDEITAIAAFSGTYPYQAHPGADLSGTTVWFSHGDADPWVSQDASRFATQCLEAQSANLSSFVRPGGHTITPDEISGAIGHLFPA